MNQYTKMNTNCNRDDSHKKTAADNREKHLERAIVIGSVLVLALVAVVFYLKFAALGNATDGYSNLGIQTQTHY